MFTSSLSASSSSASGSFKEADLHQRLQRHLATEGQLRENCYPRPSDEAPDKAKFYAMDGPSPSAVLKENERICRRCSVRYSVAADGSAQPQRQCFYHLKRAFKKRFSPHPVHECCNRIEGTRGCQTAPSHVNQKNKYANLTGYLKTTPAAKGDERNTRVLSLDCEMVFTKAGLELAQLTIIGNGNHVVFDSLVRPETEIIDYNTRYSGITAADMRGVTMDLRQVHAIMRSLVSDKTILIGHGLDSDLTALKMIHSTVVDTSFVFPHPKGPPIKKALRNLALDHLGKTIQSEGAHDSKEDAIACMELIVYKVKQEARGGSGRF